MASGFTTLTNTDLIRTNLWSRELKEVLLDDLFGLRFMRQITDFPDGTTLNIPSIGQAEVADFAEGSAVRYNKFDTGNFTFTIDQYKYSANAISEKFKRDSFYSAEVLSSFVPKQHRALMEQIETRMWNRMNASQTASNQNLINTAPHRWVARGTSGSDRMLTIEDFSFARWSLTKARVPLQNLVAIVDPSVTFKLETQANALNLLSPMPKWGDMTHGGLKTGFMYRFNIMGFDVYESNYLPSIGAETINSVATNGNGVANFMFSATPGTTQPLIMAWRQQPTVYSEFNKDLQQTEYVTFCEYGIAAYRPENIITVISDTSVAS